jgi:hypothetical protein
MAYTTADLISAVKRRSFAPVSQNTFSETDLLALADEEVQTLIVPEIMGVREEYFVSYKDTALVANQAAYAIPHRAIGMAVREVKLVDAGGNFIDLPQISPEALSSDATGTPNSFYVRDNSIVLWPTPSAAVGTLRVYFCRAQATLIPTSSAAIVSTVIGNDVSINGAPAAFTTSETYDFIRGRGGQEVLGEDLAVTGVGASSMSFTATPPSTVIAGDYVAIAGQSPLIQLPREYRVVLTQAVVVRVLKSMRLEGWDVEQKTLDGMVEKARELISPRVIGEPAKILSVWN